MKNILKSVALLALSLAAVFGQGQNLAVTNSTVSNALVGSTTLSTSLPVNQTFACVASATGIVVPSLATGVLGSVFFVDNEAMQVTGAGITSTCFRVKRGILGTPAFPHPNSSVVWIGNPSTSSGDPSRPLFTNLFPVETANTQGSSTPTPVGAITSTASVAGTIYFSQIIVQYNQVAQGACVLNGGTVGTDNHMVYLWDWQGNLLANSAVAGALAANVSLYQCFAFTTPVELSGPMPYFVGVQSNGTTATLGLYVTGNVNSSWPTGSVTGTFGTVKNIVPTNTFTTAKGPVVQLF